MPVDPGEDPEPTEDKKGHVTITKVTTSKPGNGEAYALGEEITYEITATNDGNLTVTDITVTDELTGGKWTIQSLAPGETSEPIKTSYVVTEADILAGQVVNVATASGTSSDPDEPDVSADPGEDPEPTEDKNGHITITKVTTSKPGNGEAYALGEEITYKITVTNDGNLTVSNIKLTDTVEGYDPADITANLDKTELAPGEVATATYTHKVTEQDIQAGKVINVATATGKTSDDKDPDADVTPGTDEQDTEATSGHLTVTKKTTSETPNNGYALGEVIRYVITVINDGNQTISNIKLTDTVEGYDPVDITANLDKTELAPGGVATATYEHKVTEQDILAGQVVNVATASGIAPNPDDPEKPGVPASVEPGKDTQPTEEAKGHLTIEKVQTSKPSSGNSYKAGETVSYKITVTNDGNLTITDVEVKDELTGGKWTVASLAPNESKEFNTTYTITKADAQAGSVKNVATATGSSPDEDEPNVPVKPGEETVPVEGEKEEEKPDRPPFIPDIKPPAPSSDLNYDDHVAYIIGFDDGNFYPNNNLTRAQTATMIYRLLTEERQEEIYTTENSFIDVDESKWYNDYVSSMVNGGYIVGYPDGTFGGDKPITRAEFVTILVRFFGLADVDCVFSDVAEGHWAYDYIATATTYGWINGYEDGTFRPDRALTRAEAVTVINRMLNRGVDETSQLGNNVLIFPDVADPRMWYYYEVIESSNFHEYTGHRPNEMWTMVWQDPTI